MRCVWVCGVCGVCVVCVVCVRCVWVFGVCGVCGVWCVWCVYVCVCVCGVFMCVFVRTSIILGVTGLSFLYTMLFR